ncbi:MAG TPA: hypothetical protein VIJ75_15850 [Hanamia sp.]
MRYTLLFSIFLFVIFTGCKKGDAGSAPKLKFKSVNATEIYSGNIVQFTLSFEGGSGNDTITVQEIVPYCTGSSFITSYPLPSYPVSKNQNGDITVTYGFNAGGFVDISPKCSMNDTAVFRFSLKDDKLHTSDTVSSPKVILYYQ